VILQVLLHIPLDIRLPIRAIPATFLIGPNGRVLAINLRDASLKEAVRKALRDEKLFSAAK